MSSVLTSLSKRMACDLPSLSLPSWTSTANNRDIRTGSQVHCRRQDAAGLRGLADRRERRFRVVATPMENLTSIATARRNLAQRLERFLPAKRERALTAGEATHITAALTCLESGPYPDDEDAMMLAEKNWPPRGELGKAVPVDALAERFAELHRG